MTVMKLTTEETFLVRRLATEDMFLLPLPRRTETELWTRRTKTELWTRKIGKKTLMLGEAVCWTVLETEDMFLVTPRRKEERRKSPQKRCGSDCSMRRMNTLKGLKQCCTP